MERADRYLIEYALIRYTVYALSHKIIVGSQRPVYDWIDMFQYLRVISDMKIIISQNLYELISTIRQINIKFIDIYTQIGYV